MKKEKYKVFPKFYVLISYVIAFLVIAPIAYVLYLRYNYNVSQTNKTILAILLFLIPLIIGLLHAPVWLSVFIMDKNGIEQRLLVQKKVYLKWDEIKDLRFVLYSTNAWIIVSKTDTTAYTFKEIKKKKDAMLIECTQKVILALKKHSPIEIKDYPSERFMLI